MWSLAAAHAHSSNVPGWVGVGRTSLLSVLLSLGGHPRGAVRRCEICAGEFARADIVSPLDLPIRLYHDAPDVKPQGLDIRLAS